MKNNACLHRQNHVKHYLQSNVQASYSGVTVPSFHSIRISPRCKVGVECGNRIACWVSGALSLSTGDPGTLASGLGVYDFKTHTTFFLLSQQDRKGQKVGGGKTCGFVPELFEIYCPIYSIQCLSMSYVYYYYWHI